MHAQTRKAEITKTSTPTSEDAQTARARGSAHSKLAAFVGDWQIRGENASAAPDGPGLTVVGNDSYERMPGGFFVRARFHHVFGDSAHTGAIVLGVDPETGAYFAHHYDNLGYARSYALSVEGSTWTWKGAHERATCTFGADGRTFTQRWEMTKDGTTWAPLCELKGVRR